MSDAGSERHSIELAKRGYAVTGLDLSAGMLAQAAEASTAAGLNVEWIQADATQFSLPKRYDAAICLCDGAFGLLALGDDPIEPLLPTPVNISRSLKPQAKALLTVSKCDTHDSQPTRTTMWPKDALTL